MKIGVVGSGNIGGNCARQFARGGYEVMLSGSSEPSRYEPLAAEIGEKASVGTPAEAADFGEVVVLSVPWDAVDETLAATGGLGGKIVIDTTNQYGKVSPPAEGETGAQHNAARMPGARYTKSFNTLTSGFQAETAGREGDERTVQWLCGDDAEAKRIVAGLIADAGYAPVDLGGTADAAVMEMPRREGAVYGEAYRPPDAEAVVAAVKAGQPIPSPPS
jgi:predicted dinucleotide-binding enzyme